MLGRTFSMVFILQAKEAKVWRKQLAQDHHSPSVRKARAAPRCWSPNPRPSPSHRISGGRSARVCLSLSPKSTVGSPKEAPQQGILWILFRAQPNRRQVAREQTICLTEGLWQNQPELKGGGRGKERRSRSLPGGARCTEDVVDASEHIIPSGGKSPRTNTRCYVNLKSGT